MVLNTERFTVLGGKPEKWDKELTNSNTDLKELQKDQHVRGRRSAELVKLMSDQWGVRMASSLDGFELLFKSFDKEQSIEFGTTWANKDPENREFYARNLLIK